MGVVANLKGMILTADLTSLPMLEAVVKESMRVHPVVSAGTAR